MEKIKGDSIMFNNGQDAFVVLLAMVFVAVVVTLGAI